MNIPQDLKYIIAELDRYGATPLLVGGCVRAGTDTEAP